VGNIKDRIYKHIKTLLQKQGYFDEIADDESLIMSGLLDSMAVVGLVVFMEKEFNIDFSEIYFDQNIFNTIGDMVHFAEEHGS
jgi:acyl carrier protein